MKIFITLVLLFTFNATVQIRAAAFDGGHNQIGTTISPSDSYLQTQKRSLASSNESLVSASSQSMMSPRASFWDDGLLGEEEGDINLVGGSVAQTSMPIILSMIGLYMLYHTVRSPQKKDKSKY